MCNKGRSCEKGERREVIALIVTLLPAKIREEERSRGRSCEEGEKRAAHDRSKVHVIFLTPTLKLIYISVENKGGTKE